MVSVIDILIGAGFLMTPLPGVLVLQVLLRTGWFTDGTEQRSVPLVPTTADYFRFRSRYHEWIVLGGFFGGWITTLVLYIFILDVVYFQ